MPNARNFAIVDYSLANVQEPETLWSKDLPHSLVIALNHVWPPSMVREKACRVTDNSFTELWLDLEKKNCVIWKIWFKTRGGWCSYTG